MFLGQFRHNLDEKGRLTVPARFRDRLNAEGCFIMSGFDHNLLLLTAPSFEILSQRINNMNVTNPDTRLLRRLIFASADQVDLDRAGRILIPQFLRDAANIDTEAIIVGTGDFIEIWSPEIWSEQENQLKDAHANAHRFAELDLSTT